jgi:uncharacterized membrane protein YfcA
MTPLVAAAIVGAGAVGGFANVVAGGGSLVTVPALMLTGIPAGVANGTSRLGIVLQNAIAVLRYRAAGELPAGLATLVVPTVVGAALGALLAVRVSATHFRSILAAIMLAWAALVALGADRRVGVVGRRRLPASAVAPLLFAIGVYGGFVQAAAGYLLLGVLTFGLGMPLRTANILKVALIGAYMPVAFAIFVASGNVDWLSGALLSAGQTLGGWLGAGAVMRRGTAAVRAMLIVMVVVGALDLLGVI